MSRRARDRLPPTCRTSTPSTDHACIRAHTCRGPLTWCPARFSRRPAAFIARRRTSSSFTNDWDLRRPRAASGQPTWLRRWSVGWMVDRCPRNTPLHHNNTQRTECFIHACEVRTHCHLLGMKNKQVCMYVVARLQNLFVRLRDVERIVCLNAAQASSEGECVTCKRVRCSRRSSTHAERVH